MAIRIKTPSQSFVQFEESDMITACEFDAFSLCLPVFEDNDVAFQFVLETDTSDEADGLCGSNNEVVIGIAENCQEDRLITFDGIPEKFRISPTQVLYNWGHGLPDFGTVISRGECFIIKITVSNLYEFCSNCFQRITDDCHTSVIDYGNNENAFGFNYCATTPVPGTGGGGSGGGDTGTCDPLFVTFNNQSVLAIPYTASLKAQYGNIPTVNVWIYDTNGDLVDMGIRVTFDAYPPTLLKFDFGGPASGVIKIS